MMTITRAPYSSFVLIMLSGYRILTVTHKNAGLQDIEKFIVKSDFIAVSLAQLKAELNIPEILYLATCNRVCFFIYDDQIYDESRIKTFFQFINPSFANFNWDNYRTKIDYFEGKQALEHLFETACSINSMVIGEREIFRQIREAFDYSRSNKLSDDNIRLAMRFIIEAAKSAYSKTAIGEKPLSIVSLAFQQMIVYNPNNKARVIIVGAGQTSTLFAKFLSKYGYTNISIFNRSIEGAERLAHRLNGKAYVLQQIAEYKDGFDILIVCTASKEAIINKINYGLLENNEVGSKIVIDLSVPNNVDASLIANRDFHFIEVESLRKIAQENLEHRMSEISAVKDIVANFIDLFFTAYKHRIIERALKNVPVQIKEIKHKAVNLVFKKEIEELDETSRELINKLLDYMEKGCIDIPMKVARSAVI